MSAGTAPMDARTEGAPKASLSVLAIAALLLVGALFAYRSLVHTTAEAARGDMHVFATSIARYEARTGHLPVALADLVPEDLRELGKDPWGTPYAYERDGSSFVLRSAGPDRVHVTSDDVVHWGPEK